MKAIGESNVSGSYVYDAFGHRVEQTISSVANDYIFGLDGHILHYNVSGQVGLGEDVYADGRHIALYSGGTVYMSHTDQVGSIRKWTIYNSGGNWTSQGTFSNLPFGDAQTTNSGAGVADHDFFSGFIQDPDGEFASPTRRYTAIQARWQVPDPAGLAAVDPTNPQSWNRYAYVLNNPLSFKDPTGLECVWDDGSYDSNDDPDTGSYDKCQGPNGAGGTWVDHSFFQNANNNGANLPDWTPDASSDAAQTALNLANTVMTCTATILSTVNNQFGTNLTTANVTGNFEQGGGVNIDLTANNLPAAQFNSIQPSRYAPDNFIGIATGYGASLHLPSNNTEGGQAIFSNSNIGGQTSVSFTAHIDSAWAFNPIGAAIHGVVDVLGSNSRNPCP